MTILHTTNNLMGLLYRLAILDGAKRWNPIYQIDIQLSAKEAHEAVLAANLALHQTYIIDAKVFIRRAILDNKWSYTLAIYHDEAIPIVYHYFSKLGYTCTIQEQSIKIDWTNI